MTNLLTGAVDIGGTKIQVGIVDAGGKILADECFPTASEEQDGNTATAKIAEILTRQCAGLHMSLSELRGIGISCAGPVDCEKGTIENPYTLPGWVGYPIVEKLAERTGVCVRMENDANGALLGEVKRRNLYQKKVLMVTLGTGIGAAFWNEGRLHRSGRYHPEMGHVIVSSEGDMCYCGHRGCFESLCSGKAMNERARQAGFEDFAELYTKAQDVQNSENAAVDLIQEIRHDLKNGMWTLNLIFKPDVVIMGGGFSKQYFTFLKEAIMEDSEGKEDFLSDFEMLPAFENENSALSGAVLLFESTEKTAF